MTKRRFCLPPPERPNPVWGGLSVVLHALLLAVLVGVAGPSFLTEQGRTVIHLLPPGMTGDREYRMPAYAGSPTGGGGGASGSRITGVVPSARIDTTLPPPGPGLIVTDMADLVGADSLALPEGPPGPWRLIGPSYGDGTLWVRTSEAELGVVGPSPDMVTHVARVEAAVRERLKAYIDTMPRDSFALPPPPVWTTEVDGATWGMDGSWIYLGDFKIPSALLALIPFPQGNIEQARAAEELASMRQEIIEMARRAETAEEFREYV
ncbi:MAG: hypothetical protein PVH40_06065, partial [Gemmatimonadales bacterium]